MTNQVVMLYLATSSVAAEDSKSRPAGPPLQQTSVAPSPPAVTSLDAVRPSPQESKVAVELSGPPRADVLVDGAPYTLDASGRLSLQLSPGVHEIEGRMAGFEPSHDRVAVVPGTPVQHRLVLKAPIAAVVDSTPPQIVLNHPAADARVDRDGIMIIGLVTDDIGMGREAGHRWHRRGWA